MSLAPAERRALAQIEDSLRRSDPGLAAMLERFSPPGLRLSRPGLRLSLPGLRLGLPRLRRLLSGTCVPRRWPRARRSLPPALVSAAGLLAVLAAVLAVLLSPAARPACGARTVSLTVVQVSACKPVPGAAKAPDSVAEDRHFPSK